MSHTPSSGHYVFVTLCYIIDILVKMLIYQHELFLCQWATAMQTLGTDKSVVH